MEYGKFQLALVQALMGRSLPSDFGMQMSGSAGCSTENSAVTEEVPRAFAGIYHIPSQSLSALEAVDDVILSQESVSGPVGNLDADIADVVVPGPIHEVEDNRVQDSLPGPTGHAGVDQNGRPPRIRHHPNRLPNCGGGTPHPLNHMEHYYKRAKLRRICKECRRRTKWICMGY